jgi:aryl-alcohol dehydrogenase-like predicted oxidoreductase
MKQKHLGSHGPAVSAIGLGCMRMSRMAAPLDLAKDAESIATIQSAVEHGINYLDTGDFYGMGHNEALVGQAIKGRRDRVFLSVKFGAMFSPPSQFLGHEGRPASVKNFATYSLQRLGVDVIDLYQPGRPDPGVPYEETIGAIAELIQEGKVRYLGVSEVGAENLRKAHSVHPVTALEIEYSLACRFAEDEILPTARELGIGLVPYRVLGDGLLTGALTAEAANQDPRFTPPRLQGENRRRNVAAVAPFLEMARAKDVTPAALALAWVLSRGEDIVPVVSINRRARIPETLAAMDVGLSGEELASLDAMLPPGAISGDRYPPALRDISAR